jgi:hypothetical protein
MAHFARDPTGRLIPHRLQDVFRDRAQLRQWVRKIERLKRELCQVSRGPAGATLPLDDLLERLDSIRHDVAGSMPYCRCVCPTSVPVDECPYCGGREWLTVHQRRKVLENTAT